MQCALAAMLGVALDVGGPAFDGYDRALTEYHRELLHDTDVMGQGDKPA